MNNFNIDQVRKHWDDVANMYNRTNKKVGYVHYQRYEEAIKLSDLKDGQNILNIWSRTGNLIPYIRKNVKQVKLSNAEVSPNLIKIAHKRYPNESFNQTDLEKLDKYKNCYFDRIISLETLEHTPKPLVLLKEFHRILKPNGLLVLSLPPSGTEMLLRIWETFFESHGEGPHRFLSRNEVKKMLNKIGFKLICYKVSMILPLGNDRYERLSENLLNPFFKNIILENYAIRIFYKCKKS